MVLLTSSILADYENALIKALQSERTDLASQITTLSTDVRTLRNEVREYYDHARSLEDVYYAIKFGLDNGTVPPLPPLPEKSSRKKESK